VEDEAEVVEADVDAVVLDQLGEFVALERDPDEPVDRVGEDRGQNRDDRKDEEIGDRPAPNPAPGKRAPPRPPGGGLGDGSQRGGGPSAQLVTAG